MFGNVTLIFAFETHFRHVRALSSGDLERVLKHSSKNSGYRLPGLCNFYTVRLVLRGAVDFNLDYHISMCCVLFELD